MSAAPTSTLATRKAEATRKYLQDILVQAFYCDSKVHAVEDKIKSLVDEVEMTQFDSRRHPLREIEDLLTRYKFEISYICAAVGPIALKRATAIAEATGGLYSEMIMNMDGYQIDQYVE